ncbi:hypothetical protein ACIBSW_24885 [Actinoplanes sp. NPDC049668]|uniref:hypothetical protein n=1 Tax=unclassified Actinoplanes TaxID=2626549 RepID=UPI0033AEFCA5
MSTRSYIGTRDPEQPGMVYLRYVHTDGHPGWTLPAVRQTWATTAQRDTRLLITLLLEHDWDHLNIAASETDDPPFIGELPVPEVGMTIAAADFTTGRLLPPTPVTVVAQWIYLLDPIADTIAVHISGGPLAGAQPLALGPATLWAGPHADRPRGGTHSAAHQPDAVPACEAGGERP